jgi:hypothetical protein
MERTWIWQGATSTKSRLDNMWQLSLRHCQRENFPLPLKNIWRNNPPVENCFDELQTSTRKVMSRRTREEIKICVNTGRQHADNLQIACQVAILYSMLKTSTFDDKSHAFHGLLSNDRSIRERRWQRTHDCWLQGFILLYLSNRRFDGRELQSKNVEKFHQFYT